MEGMKGVWSLLCGGVMLLSTLKKRRGTHCVDLTPMVTLLFFRSVSISGNGCGH